MGSPAMGMQTPGSNPAGFWRRVLCLSCVRPHLGTVSCLGSQAEDTLIKQRSSGETTGTVGLEHSPCEEGLQGWAWFSLEHRQHQNT